MTSQAEELPDINYDDVDLDVEDEDLPETKKSRPVKVDIGGQTYVANLPKDIFLMEWASAGSDKDSSYYRTIKMLLMMSLSETDEMAINRRITTRTDPIDLNDLLAAAHELLVVWGDTILERLKAVGIKLPEDVQERLDDRKKKSAGKGVAGRRPARR